MQAPRLRRRAPRRVRVRARRENARQIKGSLLAYDSAHHSVGPPLLLVMDSRSRSSAKRVLVNAFPTCRRDAAQAAGGCSSSGQRRQRVSGAS